jgi:hypothetical protein
MSTLTNLPKRQRMAGLIVSGLAALFFTIDGVMKLIQPPQVVEATVGLGYPQSKIAGIGITLLACTLLYVFPRTSVLGAVLLTGYLGGAVASNVRGQTPVFNVVFAAAFGCLVWVGLWLREPRLRSLLPWNQRNQQTRAF